jgi:hypothetical protein
MPEVSSGPDDQGSEQMLQLVAGQRDQPGWGGVSGAVEVAAATRKAKATMARGIQRYQEVQRRS